MFIPGPLSTHPEDEICEETFYLVNVSLVLHLLEGELHHPQGQLERFGGDDAATRRRSGRNHENKARASRRKSYALYCIVLY